MNYLITDRFVTQFIFTSNLRIKSSAAFTETYYTTLNCPLKSRSSYNTSQKDGRWVLGPSSCSWSDQIHTIENKVLGKHLSIHSKTSKIL